MGARRGRAFTLTQELFRALCSRERELSWILRTGNPALSANFPSYVLLFCLTSKEAATWRQCRPEPHLRLGVSPLLLAQLLVYMWLCLFTSKIALMAVRLASGVSWCLLCCCLVSLGPVMIRPVNLLYLMGHTPDLRVDPQRVCSACWAATWLNSSQRQSVGRFQKSIKAFAWTFFWLNDPSWSLQFLIIRGGGRGGHQEQEVTVIDVFFFGSCWELFLCRPSYNHSSN